MSYYATDSKTGELKHWKYIKKKRVNGKWRYWYADDIGGDKEGLAYEKTSGDPDSKYGTYIHDGEDGRYEVTVKKGKGLLGSTKTRTLRRKDAPGSEISTKTIEIGRIERGVGSAKKQIKKTISSARKEIDKGMEWFENLFD